MNLTHGMTHTPEFRTWQTMMQRCENPKDTHFKNYGARGITVCAHWHAFKNFYDDMGPRLEGMTIDRIDNNLGYEPSNCRWASLKEQHRNTRRNRSIEYLGKTATLIEWSEQTGIPYGTLAQRLRNGWSIDRALTALHSHGKAWKT